jgi:hypothetical protein
MVEGWQRLRGPIAKKGNGSSVTNCPFSRVLNVSPASQAADRLRDGVPPRSANCAAVHALVLVLVIPRVHDPSDVHLDGRVGAVPGLALPGLVLRVVPGLLRHRVEPGLLLAAPRHRMRVVVRVAEEDILCKPLSAENASRVNLINVLTLHWECRVLPPQTLPLLLS